MDDDWLGVCRRAARAAEAIVANTSLEERARETSRGAGGDMALAIDRAAEEAVIGELERFGVGATVITEERGTLEVAGGGDTTIVVDPIDGSLNAKRGMPHYALSIAVASGPTMRDVEFGFVGSVGETFWAARGE